ncbi:hypothetical protein Pmani_001823 [Petrolisthes manimaculis]|uniref:Uncharacterized protein n=1 Tax=Petrolisthes manimaculis TaxID=1843537 RepID=A0AAE1QJP9_9EUCA|nr:hypothetical protein Pmani_001823 [Petrolisthes manimaculis]
MPTSASFMGVDGVLTYLGNPHPCVKVQLLLALGMMVFGMGSLESSTLLPIPLYSCWCTLTPNDFSSECEGAELLPPTSLTDHRDIQVCSQMKWQPNSFPGNVLLGLRILVVLIAGVCMDVMGRRRSVLAWMGLYFVVSLARAFSPNDESVVFCVTLEAAAAQAATLSLILLGTEGSTQSECVRSACLVLLGHAVGIGALAPLITHYTSGRYTQMARSLPSLIFVLYIWVLPGSARWAVCRGRIHEATVILKKSHHMAFDPTMKHKLATLHQEHKVSMSEYKCRGHALRESVMPLVKSGRLFLVLFLFMVCGLALGCAASARLLHDPTPYNSYEDRQVAFGAFEFLSLVLLGLIVTRLHVKWVQVALLSALSIALLLTPVLDYAGVMTCGGFVFFSCLGHASVVLAGVWMTVGVIRLTPTHSRGTLLGATYAMATLGHTLPFHEYMGLFASWGLFLDRYAELGMWAILTFVAALLALLLPKTTPSLPDTLINITPHRQPTEDKPETEECQNTQL